MQISPKMEAFLKGYETGAKMVHGHPVLLPHGQPALTAYTDCKGILTIGWGHTGRVTGASSITLAQAEALFRADIAIFEHDVERLTAGGAATSQAQFDALVSFAYNCGAGNEGKSTLLKYHRAGNYAAAADEFPKWTSGGISGLVERRAAERAFYLGR